MYMWNLKKRTPDRDQAGDCQVGWEMEKLGKRGQKLQTSGYKTSKFWGCNLQHGNYS